MNVEKVEALLAAGRMREPGMAEVRAAQADGRWDAAYTSQKTATVPADVVATLDANAQARAAFDSLAKSDQYLLYLPVLQARSRTARAARIEKLIASLQAECKTAWPPPRRGSWTLTPMPFAGSGSDA